MPYDPKSRVPGGAEERGPASKTAGLGGPRAERGRICQRRKLDWMWYWGRGAIAGGEGENANRWVRQRPKNNTQWTNENPPNHLLPA